MDGRGKVSCLTKVFVSCMYYVWRYCFILISILSCLLILFIYLFFCFCYYSDSFFCYRFVLYLLFCLYFVIWVLCFLIFLNVFSYVFNSFLFVFYWNFILLSKPFFIFFFLLLVLEFFFFIVYSVLIFCLLAFLCVSIRLLSFSCTSEQRNTHISFCFSKAVRSIVNIYAYTVTILNFFLFYVKYI